MRVMVMVRPQFPVPPEQLPAMMQGYVDWRERYRKGMESFEFFAGGGGGFGVVNVPDEATLNQMMLEYPLRPFSSVEVYPILDGDTALQQWKQVVENVMGGHPRSTLGEQEAEMRGEPDRRGRARRQEPDSEQGRKKERKAGARSVRKEEGRAQGDGRRPGGKVNPIQLQKYLKGMDYPASKEDLIEKAESEGADGTIIATLQKLPGESYDTPASVSGAVGQIE